MICSNCGKTNQAQTDKCEKCGYDFTVLKANTTRCGLSSLAVITCIISFISSILPLYLQSGPVEPGVSNIADDLANIFPVVSGVCFIFSTVLASASCIRITLANGRLYGYKYDTMILTLISIVSILLSAESSSVILGERERISNMTAKCFSTGLQSYVKQHEGVLPSDENWMENIDSKTMPKDYVSPNFAINSYVAGKKLSELPGDAILAFETHNTLKHKKFYSSGIKDPQYLAINNDRHTGCIILLKESQSEYISKVRPEKLADMNWMNTHKLVLPHSVNKYISYKITSQLYTDIITFMLISASIIGIIYSFKTALGWRITSFTIISCLPGTYFGLWASTLHLNNDSVLRDILMTSSATAFIAVFFCLLAFKFRFKLTTGYLREFIASMAVAAGVLCSIMVHLLLMLLNFKWYPEALICGLGYGIICGGIMGIIAGRLVFRSLLKWQPCQPPQPAATPYQGGKLI